MKAYIQEGVGNKTKRCETKRNAWKRNETEGKDTTCETKRNEAAELTKRNRSKRLTVNTTTKRNETAKWRCETKRNETERILPEHPSRGGEQGQLS